MPEAKTFGGGPPPSVYQCSLDTFNEGFIGGDTAIARNPKYTSRDAVSWLIGVFPNTVGVETITVFAVVIDDGMGTYDIEIDGTPVTLTNYDQNYLDGNIRLVCITAIQTVAAGAHNVAVNLTVGNAVKVFAAYIKTLVTQCISVL